jgi:3-methyladenine DNA glycosylase AlkC
MKQQLNQALVERLARKFTAVEPSFPIGEFTRRASAGLDELELLGRIQHIAAALEAVLPAPAGLAALVRVLHVPTDEGSTWWLWPLGEYIARAGLPFWDESWNAMTQLTQHFTSEFAVRPFLQADPPRALAMLQRFTTHPNEHVRRWASEGCRTRLPWARAIPALLQHQEQRLAILSALRADESLYVRRSVANHLQDILKDDLPAGLAALRSWKAEPDPRVQWVVKHAARGLLKAGHPDVMQLFGLTAPVQLTRFEVSPSALRLGEEVVLRAELACEAPLRVDWVLVNPKGGRKVFRWADTCGPLETRYRFLDRSTRRVLDGEYRLELLANGQSLATRSVHVRRSPPVSSV